MYPAFVARVIAANASVTGRGSWLSYSLTVTIQTYFQLSFCEPYQCFLGPLVPPLSVRLARDVRTYGVVVALYAVKRPSPSNKDRLLESSEP